jgi:hypothetical protein
VVVDAHIISKRSMMYGVTSCFIRLKITRPLRQRYTLKLNLDDFEVRRGQISVEAVASLGRSMLKFFRVKFFCQWSHAIQSVFGRPYVVRVSLGWNKLATPVKCITAITLKLACSICKYSSI